MATRHATGRKSKAISDQSGFEVPYTSLVTQWDGLRVEPEEFDPKHPQLTPSKNVVDATSLFRPRPDNDQELTIFAVGYSYDPFVDPRLRPAMGMKGIGGVGTVTFESVLAESGTSGVGNVGTATFEGSISEAGVAGTGAVGDESPGFVITGVAGTGGVGALGFSTEIAEAGVAGSGRAGNHGETNDETIHLSIVESGVGSTGAVGSETAQVLGWGQEGWGNEGWGE
jgi:hypothetical protein